MKYPSLPETIMLHIFSFLPSFIFYDQCINVLMYENEKIMVLLREYYFGYHDAKLEPSLHPPSSLIPSYLFLDYFLYHKHLLILDNDQHFECYLRENCWVCDLCETNPKNRIIHESLRNIMRLSYFVNCLREIGRHQRQVTRDKIEQTNIGISFQSLIENIYKESESQTQMLKDYMAFNGCF